jgi:hypothetical protein
VEHQGWILKRLTRADCKSAGLRSLAGSNPAPPTKENNKGKETRKKEKEKSFNAPQALLAMRRTRNAVKGVRFPRGAPRVDTQAVDEGGL